MGGERRSQTGADPPMEQLRAAQVQLDKAIIRERIEPSGPLGVWAAGQRAMIAALVSYTEDHTARVETKALVVEASMKAEVDRVRVTNDAARAEAMRPRSEGTGIGIDRGRGHPEAFARGVLDAQNAPAVFA